MASIFRKDDQFVDKPKRNAFDMSFQNNLTTKFGVLKPVYCQEVIPGDSFKIRPDFALRFLPMVFPVQTRMKAHLHFFYVRNRTLWRDWMDFIGKTKSGLVPPYLKITESNRDMLKVGGLADMFGLPVVLNSDVPITLRKDNPFTYAYYDFETRQFTDKKIGINWQAWQSDISLNFSSFDYRPAVDNVDDTMCIPIHSKLVADENVKLKICGGYANELYVNAVAVFRLTNGEYGGYCFQVSNGETLDYLINTDEFTADVEELVCVLFDRQFDDRSAIEWIEYENVTSRYDGIPLSSLPLTDINRFIGEDGETISALPFRGYEAIYNSFYRNAENNPYMLNGVPEYNKYIPTYEGGADTNYYKMHNRNWEDDFLTTAVQSPQQGNAPLVGLTASNNTAVVVFGNEDGTKTELALTTGYDGEIVGVENRFGANDEYANVLANALRDGAVNFGMNINDLRNVNAFTRWLENNIRKGYKYRDQIKGHYGVTVRYDELDMPEFIGGVSRDVSVQQITQTTENQFGNLGDIAGQSYVMGSGETINHYCDEHGFIIGILSVVPMANYSQLIPKYLIKRDALDYYFPEFAHIGMQPILNKEVTFLESIDEGKKDEVFGYQRAWFDYLARTDEVHGLFRTNLRNFLVGRTFDSLPQLSAEFSTIQNEQLNNIFYVDDNEDKILGQIYFDVTAVRPIPIYGIPSLE